CLFLFVSLFNGLLLFAFFFCRYRHHYALHSFPTRRSSDLTFQNIRNICRNIRISVDQLDTCPPGFFAYLARNAHISRLASTAARSEEHTSELQSRFDLVCRLLLEKKKINTKTQSSCRITYS